MAGTEEQIEIDLGDIPKKEELKAEEPILEIVEEHEEETPAVEAQAPAAEKTLNDPETALKTLQERLDREREARVEAERRMQEFEARASQASNEVLESNLHLVGSAIETVKRDQELLKAQLREANLVGDYDTVTNVQEQMAMNITKLSELERGYQELQRQPRIPVQPVQPKNTGEITVDDLIERVTPRSQEWLRRNREHLPDQRSIRIMARAHEDAIDYGMVPESDAYFRFVENRMGIGEQRTSPEVETAMSGAAKVTKTRQSPPAAPVSRQPANSPSRPGVIQLTAAEVEAAKISGISPQEYYKLKMQDRNRN
jgi:hypothetical protein